MQREIEQICEWLKEQAAGFGGVVLGLSGGLDSAVVAALCARANLAVHALLLPASSLQAAAKSPHFAHAKQLAAQFGLRAQVRSIEGIVAAAARELFADASGLEDADAAAVFAKAAPLRYSNFCARTRAALLYDFSAEFGLLVAGTSNRSERELGYFTLHGDDACAFAPIADFYKSEVFALARELKIPEQIISKPPSADFFPGQSDEADLGAKYEQIDEILRRYGRGLLGEKLSELERKIIARVEQNRFKTAGIRVFKRKNDE